MKTTQTYSTKLFRTNCKSCLLASALLLALLYLSLQNEIQTVCLLKKVVKTDKIC